MQCRVPAAEFSEYDEKRTMIAEPSQPWRKLCERAAVEHDPGRLLDLVCEINRQLEEEELRVRKGRHRP